jgi:hypothetical protein
MYMMQIKKIISLICLGSISFLGAQVLDEYPKNQDFYQGGLVNFYKEAHEFLKENNAKECGENEIYVPRILVTKDGKVKQVQDADSENIAKNKCAYDLSLLVLQNLKNWKPAEVDGNNFGAIADFIFYPKDLMSNYKENYNPQKFVSDAQYPGGRKEFDHIFHENVMQLFINYNINGSLNLEFFVNENGEISNARIYPDVDNKDFKNDFFRALKRVKKLWKPAMYSNIPIRQRISYPLNFSTNFNEGNSNSRY